MSTLFIFYLVLLGVSLIAFLALLIAKLVKPNKKIESKGEEAK